MINYVKRKDINIDKYDDCIENSIQSRIYAFSWYLDIVADNWDGLVLDDYEAVMPLPWKSKFRVKYITQPYFCQQLGVFSKFELTKKNQQKFIKSISNKFIKTNLNFNSGNFCTSNMGKKVNYILKLNNSYESLLKSFSKRRKRSVKAGEKNDLSIRNTTILELIKIKKEFYNHIVFPETTIEKLSEYVISNDKGFVLGVFKDETLLGGSLFLNYNNRITYLFSSYNKEARALNASSLLISTVIKQHQNSNFRIDFEGSNLLNIGSFFESFGAKNESYFHLKYTFFQKLFL
jgi:hypothetical protein